MDFKKLENEIKVKLENNKSAESSDRYYFVANPDVDADGNDEQYYFNLYKGKKFIQKLCPKKESDPEYAARYAEAFCGALNAELDKKKQT